MKKLFLAILVTVSMFVTAPSIASAQSADRPNDRGFSKRLENQKSKDKPSSRSEEVYTRAQERNNEIKEKAQSKRSQLRKGICERKQQDITKNMPNLTQKADAVKLSIDSVYERILGYYANSKLIVNNYGELVGSVEIAKLNAEAALETMNNQAFSIDCNDQNTGNNLESYRIAVKDVRESLKTYRNTLVDLISAMRSAATYESDGKSQ